METSYFLICVSSESGMPLLTRTKGNFPSVPYPLIGSLVGVHMFAGNKGVRVMSADTGNVKVYWKEFLNCIKLIILSTNIHDSDLHLDILLTNIFNSIVLLLGEPDLVSSTNPEKLKKDLKRCTQLIDALLTGTTLLGDTTQTSEMIMCASTKLLQDYLNTFSKACRVEFACLLFFGKIVVATTKWWQLLPLEVMLVLLLLRVLPSTSARDLPIYLPHGSPKVPYRLMTFQVLEGAEVCLICGPSPALDDILLKHLVQVWRPAEELLRASMRAHPRCLPPGLTVDSNTLGFLLVDLAEGTSLSSVSPTGTSGRSTDDSIMNPSQRLAVLRSLYKSTVGSIFPFRLEDEENPECAHGDESGSSTIRPTLDHRPQEFYAIAAEYKLHALWLDHYQLFVIYSKEMPLHCLSTVSINSLSKLTSGNFEAEKT